MTESSPASIAPLVAIAFSVMLLLSVLLKFWLASRQIRHVAAHRKNVPLPFAEKITLEAHQKAADYTVAQMRLGLLELAFGAVLTLGWTLLGGLDWLNQFLLDAMSPGLAQQVALVVVFAVVGSVLDLPFSLYRTFVLEQRFGFNKVTPKLWIQDLIKSTLIAMVLGLPLLTLVLWMMGATGPYWWLWTWATWMAFNLLMLLVYPTWIAPWFNQFKPLENAALQQRVQALMERCGFNAQGFYVMDGSRRSAHANAYFTGFGKSKRVVFYDTLLAQLNDAEVDAVLAHELGHFKHRHIAKRMVSIFGMSLLGFAVLGWLSQQIWFYTGLGVQPQIGFANDALALLLMGLVLPVVSIFITPVFAQLSRRHEFEADAFAMQQTQGADLASALLKLYQDNASTLTPDPIYARYYYSHPPASERLGRMGYAASAAPPGPPAPALGA